MYGITIAAGTTSNGTTISTSATLAAGMWAVAMETTFCSATLPFTAGWSVSGLSGNPDLEYQSVGGPGSLTFASSNLEMQAIGWTTPWQYVAAIAIFDAVPTIRQTRAPANNYTVAFFSNLTAGSTILIQVWSPLSNTPATDFTITDSQGNTYTKLFYEVSPSGFIGEFAFLGLWIAQGASSGPNTVTFTPIGGTPSNFFPRILELSHTAVILPTLVSIAVTPSNPSVNTGLLESFTATGAYSDSSTADVTSSATWTSSDPTKATINSSTGVATTIAAGTTTIEAAIGAVNGSTLLTVDVVLVSIAITPATASIASLGSTQQYQAIGHYSDSSTADITSSCTWASSVPSVATTASTGIATSGIPGSSNITATKSSVTSNTALLTVTTAVLVTVTGSFQNANTARVANGSVSFTRRAYFSASGAQLLTDGTPVVAQLDGNGSFSVQLDTYDSIVKPTPYAMVVYDAQGDYLMDRFVYFQGGTHILNDVPVQNDGTAFPTQYPGDTGYRLIQGGFGSPAANGSIIFKLYQQAVTNAGVQIVPTPLTYQLDGSGNLPAGVYLYLQAELSPKTVYLVEVLDSKSNQLSKAMYSLSTTAPGVTNLNDLATSIDTQGNIGYSNIPGSFWAAIPWLKS